MFDAEVAEGAARVLPDDLKAALPAWPCHSIVEHTFSKPTKKEGKKKTNLQITVLVDGADDNTLSGAHAHAHPETARHTMHP